MSEYNENAYYYKQQVVIRDTTGAGSTSGGLVVLGGISGKDTYITGHVSVNNVKITPNRNDIIFEQQATLSITENFTNITDFYFDDSVANSFKATINVTVSGGISKYALWEINGVYKPAGWVITSSFAGDQTGINFKITNVDGRGQIQYTNSNVNGTTTTIRYRANTTAPPGSTPLGSDSSIINNTSGPYIANRLLYSNSTDTIANTDLVYTSNVFTIGGTSRILAQNANSFTNFSNGGGITSMGDASVAKKMIVGEKVGIVTTAPQYHLDVTGDINFTGNFYKNGSLYSGSSIWDTNANNEIFTTQNLGIGTSDPTYKLDVSGGIRVTEAVTAGALHVTNANATNISSGTLNLSTGLTSSSAKITDIANTNSSIGTLNVTALTAGNINFTGTLYENGTPYVNSQWTTGTGGNLSYTNGNVGINTTAPQATLDVRGTINVSTGVTAANLNVSGTTVIGAVTTGTLTASTINSSLVAASVMSGGSLSLSGDLFVAGSLTAVNITTTNLMDTNITAGVAKITDAGITTATIATLLTTNQNSTNVSTATLNVSTGLTSASAQITNQSSTNISAATLNVSTGVTTASLQATNVNITTATVSSLVATNQTVTNVSSATLNLSTGLTSASAQITNVISTNVTSTNVVATNSSIGTVNAAGATIGGNMVPSLNVTYDLGSASLRWRDLYLSGNTIHLGEKQLSLAGDAFTVEKINLTSTVDSTSTTSGALVINGGMGISKSLNVNGTVSSSLVSSTNITSTNVTASSLQVTNENVTNSTIATARITTSLLATGTSNTIGNIFTTGGNVGIGIVNPSLRFEVSGRSVMKNAGTGTSGALYLDDSNKGIEYSGNNASVNSYFEGSFPTDGIAVFGYSDGALGTKQGGSKTSLAWNTTGNVGIGTTAPGYKLDVMGTARITTSVTTGALYSTNITSTNIVGTNISSGTLNLSTGMSSASAQITNLNATTATVATLLTTNQISTNISSGTLNLSTGISSASAQITTSTIGTVRVTNTLDVNGDLSSNNYRLENWSSNALGVNSVGTTTYYKIATLPTTGDTSGSGGVSIRGMIGGWANSEIGNIDLFFGTRNGQILRGEYYGGTVSTVIGYVDLEVRIESNFTHSVYLKCNSFFKFDIIVAGNGLNVTLLSPTSTGTTSPTGSVQTASLVSSLQMYNIAGNVGIGTNNPGATLDVSGTGRITTSLTTGALYSTNQTSTNIVGTNISAGTLLNTNQISTNISSGTLNLSTGISSASAQITNANATTATVATLLNTNAVSTNFSAGTVSATTITGGSISLSGNLNVAGTLTVVNITATNLMDTNLTAGIARITTNLAAIGNSNTVGAIYTTGGNVGIGTTAPAYTLDVTGTLRSSTIGVNNVVFGSTTLAGNQSVIVTNSTGSLDLCIAGGGGAFSTSAVSGDAIVRASKSLILQVGSGNAQIFCASSGNIGIGTTAPTYTLDVTGTCDVSTSITTAALFSTNITSTNIVGTNVSSGTLNLSTGLTSASAQITNENVTTSTIATARITTSLLAIGNSNTIGNIFTTGGNVGIGTTSPFAKLHVNGSIRLEAETATDIFPASQTDSANLTQTYISFGVAGTGNDAAYLRQIGGSNSYKMALDIHDDGEEPGFCIRSVTSTNNPDTINERFTVQANGNVGIGTTAPSNTLDVSGTGRITTSLTTGAVYSTNITSTNIVGTNISSGTLNLSTGLTSASAQITNENVTTSTIATLRNTNAVSTNVSSGTLTLSTGLTSASAQITNANVTTATVATLLNTNANMTTATVATLLNTNAVSTNFSAGTVSATTITGGSISLSGNLSVAGTLTVVNITATNLMDTNLTAGSARITTNLAAIGNSNTVGAIITTGGNVGIGTTAPSGMLHLNGSALFTSTGNLTCTGDIISFGSLSDARLKKNIESISTDQAIDIISKLRSVTFDWRDDIFNENKRNTSDIGFIAQEVESIVPLAVDEYTEVNTGEVFKRIKHERLIPYLLSAIQYLLKKESL